MARQVGSRFIVVLDNNNAVYIKDINDDIYYTFDVDEKNFFEECSDDTILRYLMNEILVKSFSLEERPSKRQCR